MIQRVGMARVFSVIGALVLAGWLGLVCSACSRGGQQEVETGGASGESVDQGHLRITRVEVHDDQEAMVVLTDEGRIMSVGEGGAMEVMANLSPEGRVVDPEGTLVGTLHPDGRYVRPDGTVAATIAEDGTITSDAFEGPVTLRDDGTVLHGSEPVEMLRVRGLTEHNRRAAGLLVFITTEAIRDLVSAIANAIANLPAPHEGGGSLEDGEVDCARIDDPEYRQQVQAAGIDPDSIECNECDGCDE